MLPICDENGTGKGYDLLKDQLKHICLYIYYHVEFITMNKFRKLC